jgi:hypothetical protein
MRICRVIFSTNRVEYLIKTLTAQKNLIWDGCQVDSIFIDDYPTGRDDLFINDLVRKFGYDEVYLHKENLGLSVTWSEFWNLVRERHYDYIWHQEDDVIILEPVKVMDLVELLQQNPQISQAVLKRQKWYGNEDETGPRNDDIFFQNYRYEWQKVDFSPMASLYSIDRVKFPYSQFYATNYPDTNWSQINLNEGMIGKALYMQLGLKSAHLKGLDGRNLVEHIGEYFTGRRVLPDEPFYYEQFARYDPNKKYSSRTGEDWI